MSIKETGKELLKEASAIVAGFKLAIIVVGNIGAGSVAKWVLEHWYPFTRQLWDWFAEWLSIPLFPIVVKDSLTALVFFLPLGCTAIYQIFKPPKESASLAFKAFSGALGMVFFYLVTRNVTTEILANVGNVSPNVQAQAAFNGPASNTLIIIGVLFIAIGLARLTALLGSFENRFSKSMMIFLLSMGVFVGFMASVGSTFSTLDLTLQTMQLSHTLTLAALLLVATLFCIGLATAFAPKKLLLATGATLAFVLTAVLFELLIYIIQFIESTNTA